MNEMNEMNDNKILGTCELGTCELCKTTSVKLELILDKMICYECSPGFIEAIGNIKNVLIERETQKTKDKPIPIRGKVPKQSLSSDSLFAFLGIRKA